MKSTERTAMTRYATKHHSEHTTQRDEFCRKCRHEALMEWAKREGLVK